MACVYVCLGAWEGGWVGVLGDTVVRFVSGFVSGFVSFSWIQQRSRFAVCYCLLTPWSRRKNYASLTINQNATRIGHGISDSVAQNGSSCVWGPARGSNFMEQVDIHVPVCTGIDRQGRTQRFLGAGNPEDHVGVSIIPFESSSGRGLIVD